MAGFVVPLVQARFVAFRTPRGLEYRRKGAWRARELEFLAAAPFLRRVAPGAPPPARVARGRGEPKASGGLRLVQRGDKRDGVPGARGAASTRRGGF